MLPSKHRISSAWSSPSTPSFAHLLVFAALSAGISLSMHAQVSSTTTAPAAPVPDITSAEVANQQNYNQPLRPQFHYTPIQGHIGDATGLIYYSGEYHLFNIFDEWGRRSSVHKRWGHAISSDLVHWTQMPALLDTLVDHKPGSGSGVVDWNNSSGLRRGSEKALLIFYTDYEKGSSIAFSNDRGRTWTRYGGNPILGGYEDIRDPNVFWYSRTSDWRMIRYEKRGFVFYQSKDLIHWQFLSRIDGFYECPDLFELPVRNAPNQTRWVLIDGDGTYEIGDFDGSTFKTNTPKLKAEYGPTFYATQAWKNTKAPLSAIQLAWLKYPRQTNLTWDGQMSFPVDLSVVSTESGPRLARYPIDAIKTLTTEIKAVNGESVGQKGLSLNYLPSGGAYDIKLSIEAENSTSFGFSINGKDVVYSVQDHSIRVGDVVAPFIWDGHRLDLRVLVDRSSLEVFTEDGLVSVSLVTLDPGKAPLKLFSTGPKPAHVALQANMLESSWNSLASGMGGGAK